MVRAFISVDFAEKKIQEKIKEIQDQLLSSNAHLRIVNPTILHITLEFLGEITEEQNDIIKNQKRELIGALCINIDISDLLTSSSILNDICKTEDWRRIS